jgi:hypothetical protein
VACGPDGRLSLTLDGAGHQIGITGPGTGAAPPVLLPITAKDHLRVPPGADVPLPVRLFNPRAEPMTGVTAVLTTAYPTVQLTAARIEIPTIEPGGIADLSGRLAARFTAGAGYFAPARINLDLTYDDWHGASEDIDRLVTPELVPAPAAYEVLDGRTRTFPVFRQKGNQGGGASVSRTVTEGKGNGNGILEPGEEATIWVRMLQGMDPFDKGNWYRAKVYSDSPYVAEIADIQEQKQREWTGAQERTSLIRLSADTPLKAEVALLLDNESWSFTFTPDVRYGREKLYQAFQLHTRHLHRLILGARSR